MGKKIKFKENKYSLLPEGRYTVTISETSIEKVASQYDDGEYEKIVMKLKVLRPKEYKNEEIIFRAANNPTVPTNRFRKLIEGILVELPEEIDLDDLIGIKFIAEIEHKEYNNDIFLNIVSAQPAKQ